MTAHALIHARVESILKLLGMLSCSPAYGVLRDSVSLLTPLWPVTRVWKSECTHDLSYLNQRDQAIRITFRSENQLAISGSDQAQHHPGITAHVYCSLTMLAMPHKFACTLHMLSADRGDHDPDAFLTQWVIKAYKDA